MGGVVVEDFAHFADQRLGAKRLLQKGRRIERRRSGALARHQKNPRLGFGSAEPGRQFVTAHLGHFDVREQQVDVRVRIFLRERLCLSATRGREHAISTRP
jgi:hypothetical protein